MTVKNNAWIARIAVTNISVQVSLIAAFLAIHPLQAEGGLEAHGETRWHRHLADNNMTSPLLFSEDSFSDSRDAVDAAKIYRNDIQLGDIRAKVILGENMVLGKGVSQDIPGGLALMTAAASSGDTNASMALGNLYARGALGPAVRFKAIEAYEEAASRKRTLALVRLGEIYRDGRIVPPNSERAASYFRKAIEAGRTSALVTLGMGLAQQKLTGVGSRSEGIAYLIQAQQQGVKEAALALSDCYLYGYGVRQDTTKAIVLLRRALADGNFSAGRRLISIYRDGRRKRISPNKSLARTLLTEMKGHLEPSVFLMETLLLRASKSSAISHYRFIQDSIQYLERQDQTALIGKLRTVNPNAYVYVIQSRLKEMKLYERKATGQLTTRTVRAINKYCRRWETQEVCDQGPLTPHVAEILSFAF